MKTPNVDRRDKRSEDGMNRGISVNEAAKHEKESRQFVSSGACMSLGLCILRFGDLAVKWSEKDNNGKKKKKAMKNGTALL